MTHARADDPDQEVLVTGNRLGGYWSVTAPRNIEVHAHLFSGIEIDYTAETQIRDICRIKRRGDKITAICSSGDQATARGSLDGQELRFRWSGGPASLIFDGTWDGGDAVPGAFSGGVVGLSMTGDVPASLHRVAAAPAEQAPAESLAALGVALGDLHNATVTTDRYEVSGAERLDDAKSWPGGKEDAKATAYLGRIHVRWRPQQPEMIDDVYEVRAAGRLSLCRIGVGAEGRIRDLACRETD